MKMAFQNWAELLISRKSGHNEKHILKGDYYGAGSKIHSCMLVITVMAFQGTGNTLLRMKGFGTKHIASTLVYSYF
jgi:hypothetical protein